MGTFTTTLDDVTLHRARKGELEALEMVYRTYDSAVFNLARRIVRAPHEAEEVLQETFLEVIRSIKHYRGDGAIGSWLRSIAASKALMHLRRRRRGGEWEELDDTAADAGGGHPLAVKPASDDDRLDLESALDTLPDAARAVIWLHDVEGYTHDEIAAMAGKSASFSKSQLARAHVRLRDHLEPRAEGERCTHASMSSSR